MSNAEEKINTLKKDRLIKKNDEIQGARDNRDNLIAVSTGLNLGGLAILLHFALASQDPDMMRADIENRVASSVQEQAKGLPSGALATQIRETLNDQTRDKKIVTFDFNANAITIDLAPLEQRASEQALAKRINSDATKVFISLTLLGFGMLCGKMALHEHEEMQTRMADQNRLG